MRVRLVLIPVVAAAALLAGCSTSPATPAATTPASNGVAELSANEILAKASDALGKVDSYSLKGTLTQEGDATTIDFKSKGSDIHGKVDSKNLTIEIIRVGGDFYLKGLDDLFGVLLPPAGVALIKDKFVKLDLSKPQYAELAATFATTELLKAEGTATKGQTKTINGTPAIGLVDSEDNSVLYIATVGEPLPLRIEASDGTTADFVYHESFTITAPAASEVVESSALDALLPTP